MGKHYPKMQCSMMIATLSIFIAKTKSALTGVTSRIRKSLAKQLILLNLYFLLKLTYFLGVGASLGTLLHCKTKLFNFKDSFGN